jgi:hypothetical protein
MRSENVVSRAVRSDRKYPKGSRFTPRMLRDAEPEATHDRPGAVGVDRIWWRAAQSEHHQDAVDGYVIDLTARSV